MTPKSTLCFVVVEAMTLKERVTYNKERDEVEGVENLERRQRTKFVASYATVFILQGFEDHRKQPVGYFLSSGPIDSERLQSLLLECIDKTEAADLNVKVVVRIKNQTTAQPFFFLFFFLKVTESESFFEHNSRKKLSYM